VGGILKLFYYRKASGRIPVIEFIDSLPVHDRNKILYDLNLLAAQGTNESGLSLRHIEGKLWEIRLKLSAGYRIFYCIIIEDIYLLHAYKKQSQKAPEQEIKVALQRMKEVLS
jgi:phage-related protein